jgi:hypothetical protein
MYGNTVEGLSIDEIEEDAANFPVSREAQRQLATERSGRSGDQCAGPAAPPDFVDL